MERCEVCVDPFIQFKTVNTRISQNVEILSHHSLAKVAGKCLQWPVFILTNIRFYWKSYLLSQLNPTIWNSYHCVSSCETNNSAGACLSLSCCDFFIQSGSWGEITNLPIFPSNSWGSPSLNKHRLKWLFLMIFYFVVTPSQRQQLLQLVHFIVQVHKVHSHGGVSTLSC